MGTIFVDFHYGGSFSRDWLISYTGGEVKRFEGLDPGKFSFLNYVDVTWLNLKVQDSKVLMQAPRLFHQI